MMDILDENSNRIHKSQSKGKTASKYSGQCVNLSDSESCESIKTTEDSFSTIDSAPSSDSEIPEGLRKRRKTTSSKKRKY